MFILVDVKLLKPFLLCLLKTNNSNGLVSGLTSLS